MEFKTPLPPLMDKFHGESDLAEKQDSDKNVI